jgi:hypothetical protein
MDVSDPRSWPLPWPLERCPMLVISLPLRIAHRLLSLGFNPHRTKHGFGPRQHYPALLLPTALTALGAIWRLSFFWSLNKRWQCFPKRLKVIL